MKLKLVALFGLIFLVSSCDCDIHVNGKVLSSETGEPLRGAKIEMVGKNILRTSDEYGNFGIGEMTGFCYSPKLRITFDGYKPFEIELEADSDYQNYKLTRISESVKFKDPVYPESTDRSNFISSTWIETYSRNFEVKSDSLIIYLDEINLKKELELIERQLKNKKVVNNI